MKFILFACIMTFSIVTSHSQKRYDAKEAGSIVNNLTPDQKLVLLNQLINADDMLMDDALNGVITSSNKNKVDEYLARIGAPVITYGTAPAAPTTEVHHEGDGHDHSTHAHQNNQAENVSEARPTYKIVDKSMGPLTTVEFDNLEFDYGNITEGEVVTHVYKFTNTGAHPLVIADAKGSCGCTVPEWPKDPIAPGATGEIKVSFNSGGKGSPEGLPNSKRVTLTTNTDPNNIYLIIKGTVTRK